MAADSSPQIQPPDQDFISLQQACQTAIFGQPRTGKGKYFVILQNQYVYKGPFKGKRLEKLQWRSQWFKRWQTPHILHPLNFLKQEDGVWVQYPNLVLDPQPPSRWHEESFSDYKYRIIERSDVIKLVQALRLKNDKTNPTIDHNWILDRHAESLVLALVHLWLLSGGDVGLHNILVRQSTQEIFLIDWEETRTKDRPDGEFYFTKSSGKHYSWLKAVTHVYPLVSQRLKDMLNDKQNEEFFPRLREGLRLLEIYGSTLPGVTLQKVQEQFEPPKTIISSTNYDENFGKSFGSMLWLGLRGPSQTFSGLGLDVVKSGVQKYVRRGMSDKALQCAFELWRMVEAPTPPDIQIKPGPVAAQSNLYNRLAVICVEDIGPANIPLITTSLQYIWDKVHNNDKQGGDRVPFKLATLVELLVQSPKTRVMSHIWRAYATPEGRVYARQKGLYLEPLVGEEGHRPDPQIKGRDWSWLFKDGDPEVLIPWAQHFQLRLEERNCQAVAWLAGYLRASQGLKVARRNKRTKPLALLWSILCRFLPQPLGKYLAHFSYVSGDYRAFLMTGVTLALYRPRPGWPLYMAGLDWISDWSRWEGGLELEKLLRGDYGLVIDSYVIDQHTKQGRLAGLNRHNFVRVGAQVENQDPVYHIPVLEEIYLES